MSTTDSPHTFRAEDLPQMTAEEAVHAILAHAADSRASDVFLLSNARSVQISIRRLGIMQVLAVVPAEHGRHFSSHIKALAGMDIAEHRRPQEGRLVHAFGARKLDLRISCISTLHGQDMTMRLWDSETGLRHLDQLGMTRDETNKLVAMLNRPSGLLLVTGPAGTGKTTTLYACLQYLNNGERKINTLEDPVEYALDGIRQSQINERFGMDFSDLLRNVLRQSPDIVMIGEVRDKETAAIAVRAATSGHMVMATLHAPVASGAVQSMLALGAHPYFLSSCLIGVIAQRLVRTLCADCRAYYDISEAPHTFDNIRSLLAPGEGKAIYGPSGCERCFGLGYTGRTGLFEVMMVTQKIRGLLAHGGRREDVEQAAIEAGMVEFRRGAMLKVARGVTSAEEVLREVPAEYLGLED